MPSCLRLFWQLMRAAAARTFWTAGRSRPMSTAMMAITTRSSISVNAGLLRRRDMGTFLESTRMKSRGHTATESRLTGSLLQVEVVVPGRGAGLDLFFQVGRVQLGVGLVGQEFGFGVLILGVARDGDADGDLVSAGR